VTIPTLSELIRNVVYSEAGIKIDHSKPDGCPQKLLDFHRIAALGWRSASSLADGLTATYQSYSAYPYLAHVNELPTQVRDQVQNSLRLGVNH
jgi:GDP-L-fucose synthase